MGRTVGLTRGCACFGNHILPVRQEVCLPVFRPEDDLIVRNFGLLYFDRCFLTQLRSELHRILGTYFHTAAAGYTVVRIDLGYIR